MSLPGEDSRRAWTVDFTELRGTVKPRSGSAALARRVHFLTGLAVAPFLAVLCLTGPATAFSRRSSTRCTGGELFVDSGGGLPQPVSGQVAAALASQTQGTVKAVIAPTGSDRTTRVVMTVSGLPDSNPFSAEDLTVYINPYTDRVRGELGTVKDRPPAHAWLRHAHGNLHLGPAGRLYSEFATSWVPVVSLLALGTLVLVVLAYRMWWDRRRHDAYRLPAPPPVW